MTGLDAATAEAQAIEGLLACGLLRSPDEILFAFARDIPGAYVLYDLDYQPAKRLILDFSARGRDWKLAVATVAGEYGGMEDALLGGQRAARSPDSTVRSGLTVPSPLVTVVIPVYNEAKILPSAAADLVASLDASGWDYEVIFAENGSRDATLALLAELSQSSPRLRHLHEVEPNYGRALKHGILEARGHFVICEEIDLLDADFHRKAVALLEGGGVDMVVGSKAAVGARDQRPLIRQAGTLVLNGLLRLALGYRGTDTHGLKAFRREALIPVAQACKVERDLFASEFVVRAYRMGVRVVEVPVTIKEKRRPSVHLFKRVPNVLRNLFRLFWVIRIKGG